MSDKKSFWTTLPGILTGIAAVITAIGGILIFLNQKQPPNSPNSNGPDNQHPKFRITEVFLRADPFDYVGPCPVAIRFSGRISVVGGSGTVSYKFLRSDGAFAPIQNLTFDSPGSKDVSTTWTLGAPGVTYSGWESIQVFEPQEINSNQASFNIQCR